MEKLEREFAVEMAIVDQQDATRASASEFAHVIVPRSEIDGAHGEVIGDECRSGGRIRRMFSASREFTESSGEPGVSPGLLFPNVATLRWSNQENPALDLPPRSPPAPVAGHRRGTSA